MINKKQKEKKNTADFFCLPEQNLPRNWQSGYGDLSFNLYE